MGNRQISQLGFYDYIAGISFGSIAAEMAVSPLEEVPIAIIAMVVYAVVTVLLSFISQKSVPLRRWIEGTPLVIYAQGKIYNHNLKKAKIDTAEFLTYCRLNGYFTLDDLYMVILEDNGQMSFLPAEKARPVNTKDMKLTVKQSEAMHTVIMDGVLLKDNLESLHVDEQWLLSQLATKDIHRYQDVTLALMDHEKQLKIYSRLDEKYQHSIFL